MHIPDAVLSNSTSGQLVLAAGWMLSAGGVALGLRRLDYEKLPQVGLLGSAFFVASLVQVPMGVTSVHLVLTGLLGLILGWAIFPVVGVGLLLQFLLFQAGGITTLGINTLNMALPGVLCWYVLRRPVRSSSSVVVGLSAFAAGIFGVVLAATLTAATVLAAGRSFEGLSLFVWGSDAVVAGAEGIITGVVVLFVRRVRPELLAARQLAVRPW